jgi:hypothetical protein
LSGEVAVLRVGAVAEIGPETVEGPGVGGEDLAGGFEAGVGRPELGGEDEAAVGFGAAGIGGVGVCF